MSPTSDWLFGDVRKLAEGKISCACGNADWTGFLYIHGGPGRLMAGCKHCGRAYRYQPDGSWLGVGGPAPPPKG